MPLVAEEEACGVSSKHAGQDPLEDPLRPQRSSRASGGRPPTATLRRAEIHGARRRTDSGPGRGSVGQDVD
jgi:hypothetical protein